MFKIQNKDIRNQVTCSLKRSEDTVLVTHLLAELEQRKARFNDKLENKQYGNILLALGVINDVRTLEAITEKFHEEKYVTVKMAAAMALLAFNRDEAAFFLSDTAYSGNAYKRKILAEILGKLYTQFGVELLITMLNDRDSGVKRQAIESLRKLEVRAALPYLHPLLSENSSKIQETTVKALAHIASSESVLALRGVVLNEQGPVLPRLAALDALHRLGTHDGAVEAMIAAITQDETILGLRGYNLLGDLRAKKALPLLRERLSKLEEQTRDWRAVRDAEREGFSEEQAEEWRQELADKKPVSHWGFELAYAIAQIDPEKSGLELLAHDLADVRYGAWMGIGKTGDVALLVDSRIL